MATKKIISRIVLGMIGMATVKWQCNASNELPSAISSGFQQMSDQEFWSNLGRICGMVDRIGNSLHNDFNDVTLIKIINATFEEYIMREKANDFYANCGNLYFLEELMKMLAHCSQNLSQIVKNKVPEILKKLYPYKDTDVDNYQAARLIFSHIRKISPESLGEYRL